VRLEAIRRSVAQIAVPNVTSEDVTAMLLMLPAALAVVMLP
jgi:hypothetical protein